MPINFFPAEISVDSAVLSSEVPPMRDNEEVSITETHTGEITRSSER